MGMRMSDAQTENFGSIAGLYAIALALASVTSNDGEVGTGDGKDGAAVVGVGVELALLGVCEGTVRHGESGGCVVDEDASGWSGR